MSGETLDLKQSKALGIAMSIPVDLSMPCSRVCAAIFLCTFFFFSRNNLWHKKRPNELGLLKELDRC